MMLERDAFYVFATARCVKSPPRCAKCRCVRGRKDRDVVSVAFVLEAERQCLASHESSSARASAIGALRASYVVCPLDTAKLKNAGAGSSESHHKWDRNLLEAGTHSCRSELRMTDPVMFTRGFSIALVSLLQAIMPSVIAVGTLVIAVSRVRRGVHRLLRSLGRSSCDSQLGAAAWSLERCSNQCFLQRCRSR